MWQTKPHGYGPQQSEPAVWYADTGVSHHIVSNSEAISNAHLYSGTDALMVGNGKKLSIHKIGSFVLSTSNHPLRLKIVLQVPTIQKNLISVSQLTKDNNVFMKFHPSCCFVKDKMTSRVILKGILKDRLYLLQSFDPFNNPMPLQCQSTSEQFLHNSTSDVQSFSNFDSNNVVSYTFECAPSTNSLCTFESVNTMLNSKCSSTSASPYAPYALTTFANLFLNDINIWHLKLGHPNSRVSHSMLSQL